MCRIVMSIKRESGYDQYNFYLRYFTIHIKDVLPELYIFRNKAASVLNISVRTKLLKETPSRLEQEIFSHILLEHDKSAIVPTVPQISQGVYQDTIIISPLGYDRFVTYCSTIFALSIH